MVTAHSEKEDAKPTYKKGFGFHPLLAFIDHGRPGCGEPVAGLLRPGNAGSNTTADHITLVKEVLAGLPGGKPRPGKSVLIRTDTAGGTHAFLNFLTRRRLSYSIGFMLPTTTPDLYRQLTKLKAWEPAYDTNGDPRAKGSTLLNSPVSLNSMIGRTGCESSSAVMFPTRVPNCDLTMSTDTD